MGAKVLGVIVGDLYEDCYKLGTTTTKGEKESRRVLGGFVVCEASCERTALWPCTRRRRFTSSLVLQRVAGSSSRAIGSHRTSMFQRVTGTPPVDCTRAKMFITIPWSP